MTALATIPVSQLLPGDVFADGSEVTMVGPSTKEFGARFIAMKTKSGGHLGVTLMPSTPVRVQTRVVV
jgi:hypothetical protein